MIDIKKIINDKVIEMVDEGVVVQTIQESIEKSVKSAINDVLTGYSFEREIEKKFKTEIDGCLESIDFTGYKQLMLERMVKVIADVKNDDYSRLIKTQFEKIFFETKSEIKLDEILELAKGHFTRYKDESDCYDKYFDLEITLDDDFEDRSFQWLEVRFREEEPSKYSNKKPWEFDLRLFRDKDKNEGFEIISLRMESISFDYSNQTISRIGNLSKIEELLLNAYLNKSKILIDDFDADNYDTSLGEEY